MVRQLKQEWPNFVQQLPNLPGLVHAALQQSAQPRPELRAVQEAPKAKAHWSGLVGLILVVAAALLHPVPLADHLWFAPVSVVLTLVGILVLWHRGNR